MAKYYITFKMSDDSMFCTNCSDTIINAIKSYCNTNDIVHKNVKADYLTKMVRFDLIFNDDDFSGSDDAPNVDDIVENIVITLESIGYDCVEKNISRTFQAVLAMTSLTLGVALMLADHLNWMPEPDGKLNKGINYGVGCASTIFTLYLGESIFKKAWKAKANPSSEAMAVLITLGICTAILDSFLMIAFPSFFEENTESTYFSLPLLVLGIIKLSQLIKNIVASYISKDMSALDDRFESLPKKARVYIPDVEEQKNSQIFVKDDFQVQDISLITIESIICVKPNEIVPIDGVLMGAPKEVPVTEAIYGKPGFALKRNGDTVFAGAKCQSDENIYLKTICNGNESAMHRAYSAIHLTKTSLAEGVVSTVSEYFLKAVIGIATISAIAWGVFGPNITYAPQIFLSVLLSACPCAFGLIDVGASLTKLLAYDYGILMCNEAAFSMHKVTDFCLDKCGTLTSGAYALESIYVPNESSSELKNYYLSLAVGLENEINPRQRGAVGDALISAFGNKKSFQYESFENNKYNPGRGGKGMIEDREIIIGNQLLLESYNVSFDQAWLKIRRDFSSSGKLPVFLAINKEIVCAFVLIEIDEHVQKLRYGVSEMLSGFSKNNVNLHVLTGDEPEQAHFLLDGFIEGCNINIIGKMLPQDKVEIIKNLQSQGSFVAMLGDKENDLSAIAQADVGIAIDVDVPAMQTADVVLNGSFMSLSQVIYLARMHDYYLKSALGIAFGMNSLAIISASGALYPFTGELVHPVINVAVMASSSLLLLLCIWAFREVEKRHMATLTEPNASLFQHPSKNAEDIRGSLADALLMHDHACS